MAGLDLDLTLIWPRNDLSNGNDHGYILIMNRPLFKLLSFWLHYATWLGYHGPSYYGHPNILVLSYVKSLLTGFKWIPEIIMYDESTCLIEFCQNWMRHTISRDVQECDNLFVTSPAWRAVKVNGHSTKSGCSRQFKVYETNHSRVETGI